VPAHQLPAAAAAETGRQAVVRLAGPPLGGALFGLARAVPFVVDALSYAFSTLSLLAMRTPFQEEREPHVASLRSRLAEGFHFVWSQPFLRTCALLFGLANFIGPGVLFAVVVIGKDQGLSGGEIGALIAVFGACLLLGSVLSPIVRRLLPVRAVLLLELWTWLGCGVFLVWPNVYVLTAGILPTALAIPSTDSVVHGYRIAGNGRLISLPGSPYKVPGGSLAVDPFNRFLYAAGNGSVYVYRIHSNGSLHAVPGSPFPSNGAGSIAVDPSVDSYTPTPLKASRCTWPDPRKVDN